MINGHGNNISAYKETIVADFSTNVYNNPLTDDILNHLKNNLGSVKNYPDCNCTSLRNKIADRFKLSSDHVFVCNGSTEAFYLLAHIYKNKSSVIPVPSFAEYEDACKLHHHSIEYVSTENDISHLNISNRLLWLGNPNNPDGRYYNREKLRSYVKENPNSIFIVDEAYIDLFKDGESMGELVQYFHNLIVIKSFTKRFAIPGIRLGYVLAHPEIIASLKKHHMPWAVNVLALKAGEFILDHFNGQDSGIHTLLQESQQLQQEISKIKNLKVSPSQCNYFMVQLSRGKSSDLKAYLLKNHGILIRDASNFRGLDDTWIRIASQNIKNNNKLINALKLWANKN